MKKPHNRPDDVDDVRLGPEGCLCCEQVSADPICPFCTKAHGAVVRVPCPTRAVFPPRERYITSLSYRAWRQLALAWANSEPWCREARARLRWPVVIKPGRGKDQRGGLMDERSFPCLSPEQPE